MKHPNRYSRCVPMLAGAILATAAARDAAAVHVNPQGTGQALLLPYYTVNKQQQTYLALVNTSERAKMAHVQFMEGRNSRVVLDFRVFLPMYDVWTGTVFALDDVGSDQGDGAALMTSDRSCTSPNFWTEGHGMLNGAPYARFSSYGFIGDGGPQGATRTREGHVQVVALADLTGRLSAAVSFLNGVPADCEAVRNLVPNDDTVAPTGGLFASGAVINVGQGTYFPYRATALDDFTSRLLLNGNDALIDPLSDANDAGGDAVTARMFAGGSIIEARYSADRRIDAVSAVLMADMVQNEYLTDPAIGAHSDWVITFPTKRFYTDSLLTLQVLPPFVESFGADGSCVSTQIRYFDREQWTVVDSSGFPGSPPGPNRPLLCHASNVLSFLSSADIEESAVLGSRLLATGFSLSADFNAGWARLHLDPHEYHALRASLPAGGAGTPGKVFRGLPTIGFWATNLVNNNVTDGVMSNYSGVAPHVARVTCTQGDSDCD